MKTPHTIETWGSIKKEERIKSLNLPLLSNYLVLENYEPFPGYFGKNLPSEKPPRSIFLITSERYAAEQMARVLKKIRNKLQHKCYGSFGYIEFVHGRYYCIRIKNLDCFERIHTIHEMLSDEGIQFAKYKEMDGTAIIKIYKNFLITKIDKEVYQDEFEGAKQYLVLPFYLNWNDFREVTMRVKQNMNNNLFDAAQGIIWTLDGPLDVVRIYDTKLTSYRRKMIHEMYKKEIHIWKRDHAMKENAPLSSNHKEMYF
jgi:hypothetical protein